MTLHICESQLSNPSSAYLKNYCEMQLEENLSLIYLERKSNLKHLEAAETEAPFAAQPPTNACFYPRLDDIKGNAIKAMAIAFSCRFSGSSVENLLFISICLFDHLAQILQIKFSSLSLQNEMNKWHICSWSGLLSVLMRFQMNSRKDLNVEQTNTHRFKQNLKSRTDCAHLIWQGRIIIHK